MELPIFLQEIIESINKAGFQAFVVGGCVRDALLGRKPSDYDITTNAHPEQIEALFSHTIPTGIKHGTVTVLSEQPVEITTYRVESEYKDHRHPDRVIYVEDLKQDLARRDFTINAMAYHPQIGLVDPFGGRKDLCDGIVRAVGDPAKRFEEDALRLLRAHRFAARFHFQIEEKTKRAMEMCTPYIVYVSVERIRSELLQILQENPYELENMTQLLAHWMPELETCRTCTQTTPYHDTNVLHHILRACALLKPFDELCMYALLMHDLAKPACKTTKDGVDHFKGHPKAGVAIAQRICRSFKLTNEQKKWIPLLVRYHDEKMKDPLAFVRKFRIELGWDDAHLQMLFRVKRCDILAHSPFGRKTIRKLERLEAVYAQCQKERPMALKDLAINGKDVLEQMEISPRYVKEVLQDLLLKTFDDPSLNQRERLIEQLRSTLWKR